MTETTMPEKVMVMNTFDYKNKQIEGGFVALVMGEHDDNTYTIAITGYSGDQGMGVPVAKSNCTPSDERPSKPTIKTKVNAIDEAAEVEAAEVELAEVL